MRPLFTAATLAAILMAPPAFSQVVVDYVTTVESTPGLLGYWRFSPTSLANSAVNGYTGTFQGGAHIGASSSGPTLAIDPTNTALVLSGNGDYVQTSLLGGITTAGTITAWINLATLPSTADQFFTIAGQSQVGNDFDLQIQTDNKLYFFTDSGSATVDATPLTTSSLNTWIFVAATFTANGERDLYVNGTLVGTSTAGGHSLNTSNALTIGGNIVFGPRYFQGSIDEVAVFNQSLTGSQISNLYLSAEAVPEPSTIGLLGCGMVALLAVGARKRVRS